LQGAIDQRYGRRDILAEHTERRGSSGKDVWIVAADPQRPSCKIDALSSSHLRASGCATTR
jgi:hypothetical protein